MKKLLMLLVLVSVLLAGCGPQEVPSSQPAPAPVPPPSSQYHTLKLGTYKLKNAEGCEAEIKFIEVYGFIYFDGVTVEVNGVRYKHNEHTALVIPLCGVRTKVGEIQETDTFHRTVDLKLYPGFKIEEVE